MRLPLRWIAILYGQVEASLALTTGVHTSEDVIKAVMAGADIANVCSVLLEHGIDRLTPLVDGVQAWLSDHEYEALSEIKGILSHKESPNPAAFERANYVKLVGQTEV
jgi:dihydroorotate dehydrogenase (fumarate)